MKIKPDEQVIDIQLPEIKNTQFNSESLRGKRYMISFHRYASCPFCNLHIHQLVQQFDEFGDNFTIVAIFDSPLDNLQQHAERHQAPFHILADEKNIYYKKYGIEHSVKGAIRGVLKHIPSLFYSMFIKGFIPLKFKGKLDTMPADFLVDENGVITDAHYGQDEADHISIEAIKAFALHGEPSNIETQAAV